MRFRCFGTHCTVLVPGAPEAEHAARRRLEAWHGEFSRFLDGSELSRLNADPRPAVAVSETMARLVEAIVDAGELTGGLADGTLLAEIEAAGYRGEPGPALPLRLAVRLAPYRRAGGPATDARWRTLSVRDGVVHRPPGVRIDSGGLAKGLFADLVAESLAADGHAEFAVDCGGDLRFAGRPRDIGVADPFDGPAVHRFRIADGALATSGIGRRSWLDARGRPAHHLLDPATGAPAYTGVVQATAVARTAVEAEARAKAALLAGPHAVQDWLPHGGAVVLDDGGRLVFPIPTHGAGGRRSG